MASASASASASEPVPVPVVHSECGEIGSDDPTSGKEHCILMRQVTRTKSQAVADTLYDTKVNPYESFENPIPPIDRLVFLSYILFALICLCILPLFLTRLSNVRRNTILVFAFSLILLLTLLQKRDGGR